MPWASGPSIQNHSPLVRQRTEVQGLIEQRPADIALQAEPARSDWKCDLPPIIIIIKQAKLLMGVAVSYKYPG